MTSRTAQQPTRSRERRDETARERRTALSPILSLVLLFVAVSCLPSCARLETAAVLARILAVEGEATLIRSGETAHRPLELGCHLAPGDTIHVVRGGQVTLSLVPGIRAVVLGDSAVTINRLEIKKSGEAVEDAMRHRRAEIRLVTGSLCGSVGGLDGESSALLSVATSAGRVDTESGGIFFLRTCGARSHVVCAEEQVIVCQRNDLPAEVGRGEAQNFEENQAAARSTTQVRAGSIEAEEIETALNSSCSAVDLERAAANKLPPLDTAVKERF